MHLILPHCNIKVLLHVWSLFNLTIEFTCNTNWKLTREPLIDVSMPVISMVPPNWWLDWLFDVSTWYVLHVHEEIFEQIICAYSVSNSTDLVHLSKLDLYFIDTHCLDSFYCACLIQFIKLCRHTPTTPHVPLFNSTLHHNIKTQQAFIPNPSWSFKWLLLMMIEWTLFHS